MARSNPRRTSVGGSYFFGAGRPPCRRPFHVILKRSHRRATNHHPCIQRWSDGSHPQARLLAVHGSLYGTTTLGGCLHRCAALGGFGTIFKVSVSGSETILYRFRRWLNGHKGQPDAQNPGGGLVFLNDQLFGATPVGGCLKGVVTILYAFSTASGSAQVPEGLTRKASTEVLFGNAGAGGSSGNGAIFSYKP